MKQKNNSSDIVTKDFLKKELKKELHEFEEKIDQKLNALEFRTDIKQDRLEKRIDENARKYRDQVLTSNDKLAKTLEVMRDENAIGFNQVTSLQKQVNSHATRIQKLEHVQIPA